MLLLVTSLLFALTAAQDADFTPEARSGFSSQQCHNSTAIIVTYKATNKTEVVPCNALNPYCSKKTNSCVKNLPPEPFLCEVDGIFPHINDCSRAYMCHAGNLMEFKCPPNNQFDNARKLCRPNFHCKRPSCKKISGRYLRHPEDNRLYVFCVEEQLASMHICPTGTIFDEENPPCSFFCSGLGTFPDPEDPAKYYDCHRTNYQIEKLTLYCHQGFHFKYESGRCEPAPTEAPTSPPTTTDAPTPAPPTTTAAPTAASP